MRAVAALPDDVPASLPEQTVAEVVEAVERGARFEAALTANGVSVALVQAVCAAGTGRRVPAGFEPSAALLESVRELMERVRVAQAKAELELSQAVYQAARERNEKTGVSEWRAGLEWLKHAGSTREHWREHREVTVHDDRHLVDDQLRRVQQMSDQELLDAAPAEWRELVAPSAVEGAG